ncbi:hypothetical protein Tco_1206090 [Tanacetum coccineum]
MYQPPHKPLLEEEFSTLCLKLLTSSSEMKEFQALEGIYERVGIMEFMQLSSEVTRRLKDKIREEGKTEENQEDYKIPRHEGALEVNPLPPMEYQLRKKFKCSGYSRVVCTKYAMMLLLDAAFTPRTSSIEISSPAKVLLKPSLSPSRKTLSLTPNG